ncbi:TIR domain-containing adapter molecule 1 [Sceloporus undulatus]|uniref:TIR domain-containing adapter molecule 1 n=1 Tax=Sceloporus undulatus TaxID=8520 RepID=UPI001C4D686E|nr:TIR domain-containing adapter molecule 1 [Sceloporus undulatus]
MAESSDAHPSLEGIFRVLAQVPRDILVLFKLKLSCKWKDQRSSQLLYSMILLTLKEETEAWMSLDALKDDPVAACIYQSRWGSATGNMANPIPLKQDAEVSLAVAQIYSLLADEKLCSPLARDEAYRAAIAAFQSSNVGKDRFMSLLDEALETCGMGLIVTLSSKSVGVTGGKTSGSTARTTSDCVPIQSSLDPQPLRSTGSPTSVVSHLEISPSPTASFLSHFVHQDSMAETSKLCGSASHYSTQGDEEGNSYTSPAGSRSRSEKGDQPKNRRKGDLGNSRCSSSDVLDPKVSLGSAWRPVECTEPANVVGRKGTEGSLSHNPQTSPTPLFGSAASMGHPQSPFPSKQNSGSVPTSVSSSAPPPRTTGSSPTVPQIDANEFFTFVILHANEDDAIACRVKDKLESMGVSNGATYSEDFLVPGHSQLGCFQNALDNSAFTLLLLTENFRSRFCAYQTNVALMDSFTRFSKTNTVIPFISKERPIKPSKIPKLLATLVPLDENSPLFDRKVKNTFRTRAIQEKKAEWSLRRQIQERERLQEQRQNYEQMLQHLSALGMNAPTAMPFPGPLAGFPGLQVPQPFYSPAFPAPGTSQPQPCVDQPSLSQPFLFSLGAGGSQPPLIIQNAQMVQIGDYNHMQVERTNAMLGTAEEEGSMDRRVENGVGN